MPVFVPVGMIVTIVIQQFRLNGHFADGTARILREFKQKSGILQFLGGFPDGILLFLRARRVFEADNIPARQFQLHLHPRAFDNNV